jgi:hypothetical protein
VRLTGSRRCLFPIAAVLAPASITEVAKVFRTPVYSEHRFFEKPNSATGWVSEPPFRRVFGTTCGRLRNVMLTPTMSAHSDRTGGFPPPFYLNVHPPDRLFFDGKKLDYNQLERS